MANGFDAVMKRTGTNTATTTTTTTAAGAGSPHDAKLGSRRIFAPQFKLQVLHSYRNDSDCRGNQRATARKYGIHRRQIQKWLQAEPALRGALSRRTAPISTQSPQNQPQQPQSQQQQQQPQQQQQSPLSLPSPPIRAATPPGPVDLSVRRELRPISPAVTAWDLTYKPISVVDKFGYEFEAPLPPAVQPPPQLKSFRLFRPYLPGDNFEEVFAVSPSPEPRHSAFEQVSSSRHRPYCVDLHVLQAVPVQGVRCWERLEAVASAS